MTAPLQVVFAGTPEFAAAALQAIHAAGFGIPLVLSQPDRPAGRGMKLAISPVKRFAVAQGLPLAQPTSLRRDGKHANVAAAALDLLHATTCDVMVVAAYGLLLPQEVLDIPRLGCINIHASLLPRWRGAAPIHRALEAGDSETGITLMLMDAGLDTGPMLGQTRVPIEPADTTSTLHNRLAAEGASLVVDALRALQDGQPLKPVPQPAEGVTYAHKVGKHEAALDWRSDASTLARRIRAFDPFPGAVSFLDGKPLKLWAAQAIDTKQANGNAVPAAAPGTIVSLDADGVTVACGRGALRVTQWQKPGGKRLPVRDFLAGFPLTAGLRLESPPDEGGQ